MTRTVSPYSKKKPNQCKYVLIFLACNRKGLITGGNFLVLTPVDLRHDVARPGDVGEDVDHLSGVGADPVPLRDRQEASFHEVRLRAVPHDGGDGRAEPVAGRHGWDL